jgi:predicted HD phosphohydrolase
VERVSFIRMKDGTAEDYRLIGRTFAAAELPLADEVLEQFAKTDLVDIGMRVDRREHALQSATRAFRAGESEEMVVACLLHDIGDTLAPYNHPELAAAILRPYVSERVCWVVAHHGLFQTHYYNHHFGRDPNARDVYRGHPHYQACVDFCENYDQNCFDPAYDSMPLEAFEPMVRRLFARVPDRDLAADDPGTRDR